MLEIGDIVYAVNCLYGNANAPAIVVEINDDDGYRWYRVTFFDNNELYWYEECEIGRAPSR